VVPPCIGELPNVYKAYEKFSGDGFTVISISFDKDAITAEKFMTSRQIPWPQIWAEGADKGPLAQAYGVSGIPAIFLIGPDGKVIAKDLRGEKLYEAIATEIARRKGGY
jgi:peroxiredoxin